MPANSQPNGRVPDAERNASPGRDVLFSAVIGLVVGGLLWRVWEPTTHACNEISACLAAPMGAAAVTLGAALAVLALRRVLGLDPIFAPTLLAFVGAGALIMVGQSLGNVWPEAIHEPLAPWWSWALISGVVAALAHWVHQPGRRWPERVVPVVVVLGLVIGGSTWVSLERERRHLAELESVGVDTVMAPAFEHYRVSGASRGQAREGRDFVRVRLAPDNVAVADWPDAYLIPVRGRGLCDLATSVTGNSPETTCTEISGGVDLTGDFLLGAGVVEGETLLLVTGSTSPTDNDDSAWTVAKLRAAVDQRVPTTLEELRDGDVD